ncbi:MAG: ABC transporter [Rhodospirillaceae bacterium]|nr:ABC transporter [Rhodospirillaceae bacterium]
MDLRSLYVRKITLWSVDNFLSGKKYNKPMTYSGTPVMAARIRVLLTGLVLWVLAEPVQGAPSIYNMDKLLSEPYPFAFHQSTRSAPLVVSPVATPGAQAGSAKKSTAPLSVGSSEGSDSDEFNFGDGAGEAEEVNDPLEPLNRVTFAFNEFINQYLLGPVAKLYNTALPDVLRVAISNLLDNVGAPVTLANDLLQGEFDRGFTTATRILINTTAGVGGMIDVAEKWGFEEHEEDFGQTLAVWGIGEGFYLVLPLLGPSNPRDGIGQFFVDSFFDPVGYYLDAKDFDAAGYGLKSLGGIVTYAGIVNELEHLRETSIDFYGALRSLYRQRREALIRN